MPESVQVLTDFFIANGGEAAGAADCWDFYQSKGWKVGSVAMKDWRAAARRWIRNSSNYKRNNYADSITGHNAVKRGTIDELESIYNQWGFAPVEIQQQTDD